MERIIKIKLRTKAISSSLFFISFFLLQACRVSLVPTYDAALQTQIENAAKMTDKLYLEMMNAPTAEKNYALYSKSYLDIEVEINSILMKNEIRSNAGDIVASVKALKTYFEQAKKDHADRQTLSNAEFLIYNEQLKALWKPVLLEEIALSKVK